MSQRKSSALVTCFTKVILCFFLLMQILIYQSSGSGSESGIQDKKSVKPESTEGSENDASISDEHRNENGSSGDLSRSDNGSGTQVICFYGYR